jgi:hypothetical protein
VNTYAPVSALVMTTDGKCPDGYVQVETTLEAPMIRDLLNRARVELAARKKIHVDVCKMSQARIAALEAALRKARDSFNEMQLAMTALHRPLVAASCEIARDGCDAALSYT